MLRSIPDKLGGVLCMGLSLIVLFLLPFLQLNSNSAPRFDDLYTVFCAYFFADFIFLGWLGSQPVEDICIIAGQLATLYYFLFLLLIIPFVGNLNYLLQSVNFEQDNEELTYDDALEYLLDEEFNENEEVYTL